MSTESTAPSGGVVNQAPASTKWKPLRIWPPVILLGGMVFFRFLPGMSENPPPWIWMSAAFGPLLCSLLILIWWIALSRARLMERIVGALGVILAAAAAIALIDKSMLGPAVMVVTIPLGFAAFAVGLILCHRMLSFRRTLVALVLAAIGFGVSDLLRSDGMWGNFALGLHARWEPSPEQAVLNVDSKRQSSDKSIVDCDEALLHPAWPGFRGPNEDGVEHGPILATDWSTNAPKQIWKIPAGPGWSSFTVAGPLLFTQEQRGAFETVVCYAAETGLEVWTRPVEGRFDDPLGGPGPRATPTLAGGALYVFGAKGNLMRLDPKTGNVVWEKDIQKIADRQPPMWGFSSSPLVVESAVVVHAGGKDDKGLLAFDVEDGELKWSAPSGDHSYSSAQLSTIAGEQVILMLTNTGLNIHDPVTGAVKVGYEWFFNGYRALQPQVVNGDSILLPTPSTGTRCISISKSDDKWNAAEAWTSRSLKPEFNDLVVYDGHAYGFDGAIFTCIELAKGDRKWKGGRYGKGQVLLQEESGLLLVIGEQGEVVLVKADPNASTELGRFQAMEGKTWNHPVLIADKLYLRNSQEAVCYQLPLAEPAQ